MQTSLAAETGALGCAIAAAAAIGDFPSLSDAAAWMNTPSETYYPKEDAAQFYRKKYALYDECCRLLLPLWPKLHALTYPRKSMLVSKTNMLRCKRSA